MILEFSLGNYRSFDSIQKLDFRATALVSDNKNVDTANIANISGIQVLKTVGIYGPNGSGKSNLIKGLALFRDLVDKSLQMEGLVDFSAEPFKFSNINHENSGFFQMVFLLEDKKYRLDLPFQTTELSKKNGFSGLQKK